MARVRRRRSPVAARTGRSSRAAYPAVRDRLYGVAASSARDVWAVGLTADSSLIMHWDSRWWVLSIAGVVVSCPQSHIERLSLSASGVALLA